MKKYWTYLTATALAAGSFVFAPDAFAATYVRQGIGTPEDKITAYAINNYGVVVGQALFNNEYHAFKWENGKMTDLGALGTSHDWNFGWRDIRESAATDINDNGVIVGLSTRDGTTDSEYMKNLYVTAKWNPDGTTEDLGRLTGGTFDPVKINNQGTVAGTWHGGKSDSSFRAFRSGSGGGSLPNGYFSTGLDLNAQGDMIGINIRNDGTGAWKPFPFISYNNTLIELNPCSYRPGNIYSAHLNDNLVATGCFGLWDNGTLYPDITGLLNNNNEIISGNKLYKWENGQLNFLADLPSEITMLEDFNDVGQILGIGLNGPAVWTPSDMPVKATFNGISSKKINANRTVPLKFDVYSVTGSLISKKDLLIKVYENEALTRNFNFGTTQQGYKLINSDGQYLLNLKTGSSPASYRVEVLWRGQKLGQYSFTTG